MMTATTAFIRGKTAAASKNKVHTPWKSQDQSKRHTSEQRPDFRNQPKDGRGPNKFTPLTRTPKEIFAAKSGKFKPPSPMVTLVEKRSNNKFYEFHNDKGHNTDECVQLRKQIEDFVYRSNNASHAVDGGKLGPKWEGPYEVTEALGDGAYKLRSTDGTVLPRTWSIANLKKCYL
ncbi:hypothetical protein Tco_0344076 [Tanacetum coccineum]